MTYQEIASLLMRLGLSVGGPVRVVEDTSATALVVDRSSWLIAREATGELLVGRRRGEDSSFIENKGIPFAEVSQGLIREKLDSALLEFIGRMLEEAVARADAARRGSSGIGTAKIHRLDSFLRASAE